jgi:hypothetical protein
MMASDAPIQGSCLCGAVKYEISGDPVRFFHCHCQRCRKTTGTGHASNLLMKPVSGLTWTQGEDMLQRYKVPDAERFYNLFCKQCGSPMPRAVPELDAVIIPAGTLDSEAPISPNGRIFWGSRADWSCESGDIPVFDEYPPAG